MHGNDPNLQHAVNRNMHFLTQYTTALAAPAIRLSVTTQGFQLAFASDTSEELADWADSNT